MSNAANYEILSARSGPTLVEKLLNLLAIIFGLDIIVSLCTISSNLRLTLGLDVIEFNIVHVIARLSFINMMEARIRTSRNMISHI